MRTTRHLAFLLVGLLVVLGTPIAQAATEIRIEAPLGGYRHSAGDVARYTQDVDYPASFVNTPKGQPTSALIRGRIAGTPKTRAPYTLVVNGVAMPLRVEETGRFSRPYAFGRGSNGVEIISPDRSQRARVQFYEADAGKSQARLRVVLSWDSDGTDLDLHVVTPNGEHAFYGNRVIGSGGALDVDVTTGYGPEIFSHAAPSPGLYAVYVNYYGAGMLRDVLTIAQVAIIYNESTPDEKQQVFRVPMRKPGELTLTSTFVYP